MENELTCCVCLDLFIEPLMLPCSHNFCKKCLWDLFHHSRYQFDRRPNEITCPKCRREVQLNLGLESGIDNLPHNKALDNIVRVYKSTYKSKSQLNTKSCITHARSLSLYCQTCKRSLCESCVLQAHNGFGHCVKEIKEFIQEEKDKAKTSLQEVESIKATLTEREAEVTTLIVNSKGREQQLRKTVEDQLEMIKNCITTQKSKLVNQVSTQMGKSRASLEKLAVTYSSHLSDIRQLNNIYKDALQETSSDRQLKLLQALTFRLSSFLTFRNNSLPSLPTAATEYDGHVEYVEEVLRAIRRLQWKDMSTPRGGAQKEKRNNATQTESQRTAPLKKTTHIDHWKNPLRRQLSEPTHIVKPSHPITLNERMNSLKESFIGTSRQEKSENEMIATLHKFKDLQLEQKTQTPGYENVANHALALSPPYSLGGDCASTNSLPQVANSSALKSNAFATRELSKHKKLEELSNSTRERGEGALGLFSTTHFSNLQNVEITNGSSETTPFHFLASTDNTMNCFDVQNVSFKACGEQMQKSRMESITQNRNVPESVEPPLLGCIPVLQSRNSTSDESLNVVTNESRSEKPSMKDNDDVAKNETLKLYFDHSSAKKCELPSTSLSLAATNVPQLELKGTNLSLGTDVRKSTKISSQETDPQELHPQIKANDHSEIGHSTLKTEQGEAVSPVFVGPTPNSSQSHWCGIGARPKVRPPPSGQPSSVRKHSAVTPCSTEQKDEKKIGNSFKEGINTAVCTLKNLCRVGFGNENKDTRYDINANDKDVGSVATRSKSCDVERHVHYQVGKYIRNTSAPAKLHEPESSVETLFRSTGTSPVQFAEDAPKPQDSVWSTFSFNDTLVRPSLQTDLCGAAMSAPISVSSTTLFPSGSMGQEGTSPKSKMNSICTTSGDSESKACNELGFNSIIQLPKWDSSKFGGAENLSKLDFSEFWTADATNSQGKQFVFECKENPRKDSSVSNERDFHSAPSSSGTAELPFTLPSQPFDFVSLGPSRQNSLGSPKYKQRKYKKKELNDKKKRKI